MSRYFFRKWFSAALQRLYERGLLQYPYTEFSGHLKHGQADWDNWDSTRFPGDESAELISDKKTLVDLYVAMYGTWHYFQFLNLISDPELNPNAREEEVVVVDIGAGPGTAMVACLDFERWQKFPQLLAYDRSKVMCDYLTEFFEKISNDTDLNMPTALAEKINKAQIFKSTFGIEADSVTSGDFVESLREHMRDLNGKSVKICLSFIIANKADGDNVRLAQLNDFIALLSEAIIFCLEQGASTVQLVCQNPQNDYYLDDAHTYFDRGLISIRKLMKNHGVHNSQSVKKQFADRSFDWNNLHRLFQKNSFTDQPRITAEEAIDNMDLYGFTGRRAPTAWVETYSKTLF